MKCFANWFLDHWIVLFIVWIMSFIAMLIIMMMAVEVPENHPDFNNDFNSDFYIASEQGRNLNKKNEDFKAILVWPYWLFCWIKNLLK